MKTSKWNCVDIFKFDAFWIENQKNIFMIFAIKHQTEEIWLIDEFSKKDEALEFLNKIKEMINETQSS